MALFQLFFPSLRLHISYMSTGSVSLQMVLQSHIFPPQGVLETWCRTVSESPSMLPQPTPMDSQSAPSQPRGQVIYSIEKICNNQMMIPGFNGMQEHVMFWENVDIGDVKHSKPCEVDHYERACQQHATSSSASHQFQYKAACQLCQPKTCTPTCELYSAP